MYKKICSLLVLFTMVMTAFVGGLTTGHEATLSRDLIVATVQLSQPTTLNSLAHRGIAILDVDREKTSAVVLASSEEFDWLTSMNLAPQIVPDDIAVAQGWKPSPMTERDFHNYAQMTTELQTIASTYPEITQLYDLGHSVQGRVIWGLKITNNPDIEEDEPEVRICGVHHGNEYMGAELSLLLAQYLTQNYGTNTTVTTLVDTREVWIIPMVNPDGREISSRENANGVDLNRDYGYMWGGWGGSPSPFSQPETQAVRANALANTFVLSLSFHCSADVVNYVWNYRHLPTPDDAAIVYLSNQYGSHTGYWVTEGYDWYQTMGDTNDFSYGCRGDIDWTIEVENSNIPQVWNLNREAMFDIIKGADMGVRGIVTSASTGQPIAATIWVDQANWPCFTDPLVGDYHKVLLPGSYDVHVRANGFDEQTYTVEVSEGSPTVLDVALTPNNQFYAYQVSVCDYHAPSDDFTNNPTDGISALGGPDAVCASLGVGGYVILDMGVNITDAPNSPDVKVYEGGPTEDGYAVSVSSNWNGPWVSLGSATGTGEFDLHDGSVTNARYVKILDDNNGNPSEQNPGADIDAVENLAPENANEPPAAPTAPTGPTQGFTFVDYTFSTVAPADPEGQRVYVRWDWGNNETSQWLGPYTAGQQATASYAWKQPGVYNVRVKARDENGSQSSWSGPLTVTIAAQPRLEITSVKGGIGVGMVVRNTINDTIENIPWDISLKGGLLLIIKGTGGVIPTLAGGAETTVRSGMIAGIGKVTITITVGDATKVATGFVLGPFLLGVK